MGIAPMSATPSLKILQYNNRNVGGFNANCDKHQETTFSAGKQLAVEWNLPDPTARKEESSLPVGCC